MEVIHGVGLSIVGLEDLNFKFARRRKIFKCAEIDVREFAEALSDLERQFGLKLMKS